MSRKAVLLQRQRGVACADSSRRLTKALAAALDSGMEEW